MTSPVERCKRPLVAAAMAAWAATSVASVPPPGAGSPCGRELSARIPARPRNAVGGAAFIASIENLPASAREAAIVAQVLGGNIPAFLRKLAPVVMTAGVGQGRPGAATVCVMPDYLAIGSGDDFVRMPMSLRSATAIARALGFVLPTPKIVDAIHEQAAYDFRPEPMRPGPQMSRPDYFLLHQARIRAQRLRNGVPIGSLLAGHKKDVVLTNRLDLYPGRVAIYGWQRRDGRPIQPLSTVHGAGYADYSHGIRLVSQVVTVDGKPSSIYAVLSDARRAGLLSGEGPIHNARALMGEARAVTSADALHAAPSDVTAALPALPAASCSSGSPDGSCGGYPDRALGFRARTARASGRSPGGPGNRRR